MRECDAQLIYNDVVNNKPIEVTTDTYAIESSVKGQGFQVAQVKGITNAIMLKVRAEDYEETRHIQQSTGKASYATKINFDGAIYDIVWVYKNNNGWVELTCK
jgi:hypothetical protein